MQHSPTTLCLSKEKILTLSLKDTDNNWILHEEEEFFMEKSLAYGALSDIQKYLKELENENNTN